MELRIDALLESFNNRLSAGGLLRGDAIKFAPDIMRHPAIKDMHPDVVKALGDLKAEVDCGNIIVRVVSVSKDGLRSQSDVVFPDAITIGQDFGGGTIMGTITIPGILATRINVDDDITSLIPSKMIINHDEAEVVPIEPQKSGNDPIIKTKIDDNVQMNKRPKAI